MSETVKPLYITELDIVSITLKSTGSKIPIKSYKRTWIDKNSKPYKYEFRGEDYQGYHNPDELIVEREIAR